MESIRSGLPGQSILMAFGLGSGLDTALFEAGRVQTEKSRPDSNPSFLAGPHSPHLR